MRIKDFMIPIDLKEFGVDIKATIKEASSQMKQNNLGFVLIIDQDKVAGILTERDLLKYINDKTFYNQLAIDFATKDLITFRDNREVEYILLAMIEHNIRRAIIVDRYDNIVGVSTIEYLIKYIDSDLYRQNIKIGKLNLSDVISVNCDMNLRDTIKFMRENRVGSCVIEKNNDIVGIFTERDIITLATLDIDLEDSVEKYMSFPVITIDVDETIVNALDLMEEKKIKRLVVKDKNSYKIIGIRDILHFTKSNYHTLVEKKLLYSKKILDSISEAIIEITKIDDEFVVSWSNKKANDIFKQNILDKTVCTIIGKNKWLNLYNKLIKNKNNFYDKIEINNSIYKLSIINDEDVSKSIRIIFVDVTELEKANEEIKQQDKILDMMRLINNISHHWRQPLSVISTVSTSSILEYELGALKDEAIIQRFEKINEKVQYISKILDEFNSFFHFNTKKEKINTKNLYEEINFVIKPKLEKNNIKLISDIVSFDFFSYKGEIVNILKEIIQNSIDAFSSNQTLKDRYLFVNMYRIDDFIEIIIKDNAGGIDDKIINMIYEPYFTTKHQKFGTGLGLTMVYSVVKNGIGGDIEINNVDFTYQNKNMRGVQVSIKLPIL